MPKTQRIRPNEDAPLYEEFLKTGRTNIGPGLPPPSEYDKYSSFIDTSTTPNKFYVHDGSQWVETGDLNENPAPPDIGMPDLNDTNIPVDPQEQDILRYQSNVWEAVVNNKIRDATNSFDITAPTTMEPEVLALESQTYKKVKVEVVQTFKTLINNIADSTFIDGLQVVTGNLILIAGQDGSNPAFPLIQNGLYRVEAISPPTRLSVGLAASTFEYIAAKGNQNAGSTWSSEQETSKSIYGVDDITFTRRDVQGRLYGGLYINTPYNGVTNINANTYDQFLGWTNSSSTVAPIIANPALDKIIIDLSQGVTHTFSISYSVSWSKGGGGVENYTFSLFKNTNNSGDLEMVMSKAVRQHSNNDVGGVYGEAYLQVIGGDTVDITLKLKSDVGSSSYQAVAGMLRIEQLN